jgi:hypothetical protein
MVTLLNATVGAVTRPADSRTTSAGMFGPHQHVCLLHDSRKRSSAAGGSYGFLWKDQHNRSAQKKLSCLAEPHQHVRRFLLHDS